MLEEELVDILSSMDPLFAYEIYLPSSTYNVLEIIHVTKLDTDVVTWGMMITEDRAHTKNSIVAFKYLSGK